MNDLLTNSSQPNLQLGARLHHTTCLSACVVNTYVSLMNILTSVTL